MRKWEHKEEKEREIRQEGGKNGTIESGQKNKNYLLVCPF